MGGRVRADTQAAVTHSVTEALSRTRSYTAVRLKPDTTIHAASERRERATRSERARLRQGSGEVSPKRFARRRMSGSPRGEAPRKGNEELRKWAVEYALTHKRQ